MINIPIKEMLLLWSELVECYHGKNGYGGCVAELYSYRFQPYRPKAHLDESSNLLSDDLKQVYFDAAFSLVELLKLFCDSYHCRCKINEVSIIHWFHGIKVQDYYFDHRVHVEIIRSCYETKSSDKR